MDAFYSATHRTFVYFDNEPHSLQQSWPFQSQLTKPNTPVNPLLFILKSICIGWMGMTLFVVMLLVPKPLVSFNAHDHSARVLSLAHHDSPTTIRLFILAGQSNMVGSTGDAAGYPEDVHELDQTIPFYWVTPNIGSSERRWTHLKPQPGRFEAGHFGPEIILARRLAQRYNNPNQSVAVFKFSQGGTSLAVDWKSPGENGLYDRMVNELQHAVSLLESNGHNVIYEGFFWVQGESDAGHDDSAAAYDRRLQRLIDELKLQVLRAPELPVVLGVDEQHPYVRQRPDIVHAQQRLARDDVHIGFTSMIGLEKADQTHLTPAGLVGHGERLFEGFLQVVQDRQSAGTPSQ